MAMCIHNDKHVYKMEELLTMKKGSKKAVTMWRQWYQVLGRQKKKEKKNKNIKSSPM